MKTTTIRLEKKQVERLEHHSERTGAPQSELIRRAIDEFMDKLDYEERRTSRDDQR